MLPASPNAMGSNEIATAPAAVGRALRNLSISRSANAATTTSPTGAASRATPSRASLRPRCSFTAGSLASHTPSARPNIPKYTRRATRARRRMLEMLPLAAAVGAMEDPMSGPYRIGDVAPEITQRSDGPVPTSPAGPTPASSPLPVLECSRCSAGPYDADRVQGTCACGAPLLARYDLAAVASWTGPDQIATRPPSLWRYHELLPVGSAKSVVSFDEGMTPLLPMERLGAELGVPRLLMKDESPLPTGSFKARGAAVGVSRAAELGATGVALPTNGNPGAECVAAGPETYLVDGLIGDAGRLVRAAVAGRPGFLDASTLREPYRLEGKKTIGLEIAEQLGWRVPDVIIFPTGGGVGLVGIAKGLRELRQLGWIGEILPRLVAVQAAGCAPIVRAFERQAGENEAGPGAKNQGVGVSV